MSSSTRTIAPDVMHAYRLVAPSQLRWEQVPVPEARIGEALLRVIACGLCGTDLHLKARGHYYWRDQPLTLGHEIVAEVVRLPLEYGGELQVGDCVVVDPQVVCGACAYCRRGRLNLCDRLEHLGLSVDGGFAEYLVAPVRNLYKVPDGVPRESLWRYALVEPVATCVAGMRLAHPQPDETVAVVGLGFFGQVYAQLARLWSAHRVLGLELHPARREVARQIGAATPLAPDEWQANPTEAHVVIDAAGSPDAAEWCLRLACKAGRIVVFGYRPEPVQVNWYQILVKELTVIGSRSSNHAWEYALRLVHENRLALDPLIAVYAFDEIEQAFADAETQRVFKPILCWHASQG
ncbi:MAG: alcohol dehydrogenase catalytic domain-containing protein [Fimbriimonadales bacterium]|nr:alcohol dehydrogenase catalytic domain-containing protein [Fimbriimonadales bacterium]